ncbi:hypothetical protein B0J11DRAFT_585459 [Dendryphion nanum]|uniref:Ketoreductase (KR) domain-containing protein n=1 Tax=Dendryphion nanum TaxID=256645 RepID=A0A9P9D4T6_9PLEO|nr:hypothetical protein B0J11DRAFT_585459 [Dendryphion nanum]
MTLAKLNAPLGSKVQGTWNLHHLLPPDMSFFILQASLVGVHSPTAQCNHAAGFSFQDGFTEDRHSRGQNCTSLDLDVISSVGYITERYDVARNVTLSYTVHDHLNEQELLFLIDQAYSCRLPTRSSSWETQILAGVTTPAQVRRSGLLEEHVWMQKPQSRHLYQIGKMAVYHPAHAFEVDLLVAVELQFWFANDVRAELAVLQILGSSTIAELGLLAAQKSLHTPNMVEEASGEEYGK